MSSAGGMAPAPQAGGLEARLEALIRELERKLERHLIELSSVLLNDRKPAPFGFTMPAEAREHRAPAKMARRASASAARSASKAASRRQSGSTGSNPFLAAMLPKWMMADVPAVLGAPPSGAPPPRRKSVVVVQQLQAEDGGEGRQSLSSLRARRKSVSVRRPEEAPEFSAVHPSPSTRAARDQEAWGAFGSGGGADAKGWTGEVSDAELARLESCCSRLSRSSDSSGSDSPPPERSLRHSRH